MGLGFAMRDGIIHYFLREGDYLMEKWMKRIIPVLPFLYMAAIWMMSGLPADAIVELPDSYWDRFIKESLHLVEFAILYMLFAAALAVNRKLTPAFSLLAAVAAGFYGIVDEIHQSFVPYRSATFIDVVKDLIGVGAAYAHVRFHFFKRERGFLKRLEKIAAKG